MKKFIKVSFVMLLVFVPISMGATSAFVSGGNWTYGVTNVVYSNYSHSSKKHGASVINYRGDKDYQYHVAPGRVARASLKSGWGTDTAYYQIG